MKKYDIFISYRRENGQNAARIIRDALTVRGYRVFFDVESMHSGKYDRMLVDTIAQCQDVILICSPRALDRCRDPEDWVRKELNCALEHGKNIIPITLDTFDFKDCPTLPQPLDQVPFYNAVAMNQDHFQGFVDKLCSFLTTRKGPGLFLRSLRYNTVRTGIVLAVTAVVLMCLGYSLHYVYCLTQPFPASNQEISAANQLLDAYQQNLNIMTDSLQISRHALEKIQTADPESSESIQWYLAESAQEISQVLSDNLTEDSGLTDTFRKLMPEGSVQQDFETFTALIRSQNELLAMDLMTLHDLLAYSPNAEALEKAEATLEKQLDLMTNLLFCSLNHSLICLENPKYIQNIQDVWLPRLSPFSENQTWLTDRALLEQQLEDTKQQLEQANMQLESYRELSLQPVGLPVSLIEESNGVINFGRYPQNGAFSSPMSWIVLEQQKDRVLVLSRLAIASQPYHSISLPVTWETCSLRQWLNDSFFTQAFSEQEQNMILEVQVPAHPNPASSIGPGADTQDHVFLLSAQEVMQFLPEDSQRICPLTENCVLQGAYVDGHTASCWWWLRSPGITARDAASINTDGSLDLDDGAVDSLRGCVRPAMWIRISE